MEMASFYGTLLRVCVGIGKSSLGWEIFLGPRESPWVCVAKFIDWIFSLFKIDVLMPKHLFQLFTTMHIFFN